MRTAYRCSEREWALASALCDLHGLGKARGKGWVGDSYYAEALREAEERVFKLVGWTRPVGPSGH